MAFYSGFFNSKGLDRTYTAENFCDYLGSLICNGIQDNYGDCFKLTAASSGLKVIVGRGKAWIDGHYFVNDSRYSIDLTEYQDESLPRYVSIAIVCDTSESVRAVRLEIVPGTPAENPALPVIPTDENRTRLLLYAVRLNVGATSLSKFDWYDYREDSNVCGYCKCILGKCKVTEMQSQLAQLIAEMEDYNDTIAGLTNKVDMLQTKVDDLTGDIIETGELGEDIYYVLYSNGRLLLRGTGATYDYDSPLTDNPQESPFKKNLDVKNIVVSSGITSIGAFTFPNCDNLETISLPNTITKIGRNALVGTGDGLVEQKLVTGLVELNLSDSVTEIGQFAFANTRIETLTIPKSVTTVGDYAFQSCINLETVRYEGTLIGGFMFVRCPKLKNVTLAKTVKIISSHWINYCDMLTSITYEGSLADWAEVTKRSNWDGNAGQMPGNMYKVICFDGYMQYDTETGEWNEVKE